MRMQAKNEKHFDNLAVWFATSIRLILGVLLLLAMLALMLGIAKSAVDLWHSINEPLETILQQVLLDVVFIIALVEIMITILGYLDDGKVHVRYIVDTILIIMLNEIVAMWFKHPKLEYAISLSIIIATLTAARVALTRFTPTDDK